ncbi:MULTISPECIES: T9SS type A sorting domain-containing protein [unclassified Winogradskyella]|uniref:T9SS type A sorting domain-containing protein n=1 Tax=unclassified Winogradskyella TaxID=2615021 RepID=UPI002FF22F5B
MTRSFTILMLLLALPIASQSIKKSSIDSGGASTVVNNIQILYTIGEVVVRETSTPTISVSEGFINPEFNSTLSTYDHQISHLNISIYPNPTNQFINIATDRPLTKVELYDVLGRSIFQSTTIGDPIEVSTLKAGVYLLRLYENAKSITKQVVIE